MANKITSREKDFSQWYQDVVLQARLADYSPVKGCMVIRPLGYSIWEQIQKDLDQRLKAMGVKNAYFPIFIPEGFLKKEAEHVEGFAPQCAVVTHAGGKELEEKLVIRPTSETIVNSMFAKWIQSYRDLPLLVNQWANVVRWEMRTRLFLRTTEFLWQEGHTCHATDAEAEKMARQMLQVYTDFAEEVLAMPVIPGIKTETEKFAGALRTYCMEAMMQDKKALQLGTSHQLSTNFAKAFQTKFLDQDGKEKFVHQTSWGVTTRLIGGMIMCHSDDAGLVLPPRLATLHVVLIPIYKNAIDKEKILEALQRLSQAIQSTAKDSCLPYSVGVEIDTNEAKQLGWKRAEYELIGTPIRIEMGCRELESGMVLWSRRDEKKKLSVLVSEVPDYVISGLESMQKNLLHRARAFQEQFLFSVESYAEFKEKLEEPGGFFKVSWCQDSVCEARVKEETKATIRCLPFDKNYQTLSRKEPCFVCGKKGNNVEAILARNY